MDDYYRIEQDEEQTMKWLLGGLWDKFRDACIEDIEWRPVMLFGRQVIFLNRPLNYDHITWKVSFEKNMLWTVMASALLSAIAFAFKYGLYISAVGCVLCFIGAFGWYVCRTIQGWSR